MSWIDNLTDITFEIQTGDGQLYYPSLVQKYIDTTEYNNTQYEYINREGSLVVRRFPKGTQYPLEFAFQGENHIIESDNFKFSAKDNRSWKIKHPIFGNITVQPLSLTRDTSNLSCTIFTVTVVETNLATPLKPEPLPKEKLEQLFLDTNEEVATKLAGKDTTGLSNQVTAASAASQKFAKTKAVVSGAIKATRRCLNAINNAISTTDSIIRYTQRIISLPATELSNLKTRVNNLVDTYDRLADSISGKTNMTVGEKTNFEMLGTSYLGSMVIASTVIDENDPLTRSEIVDLSDKIKESYNSYVSLVYSLEDENYRPNPDVMTKFSEMVNVGLFYFNQLISNARQEREFICKTDTNLIVLAHKLYGLASEENINILKITNNIGLSEIMTIKQGRKIVYFV